MKRLFNSIAGVTNQEFTLQKWKMKDVVILWRVFRKAMESVEDAVLMAPI